MEQQNFSADNAVFPQEPACPADGAAVGVPGSDAAEQTHCFRAAPDTQPERTADGAAEQGAPQPLPPQLTRVFSERLKAMSQKKLDEFVAGLGLTDGQNRPILTEQQYRQSQTAQPDPAAAMLPETPGEQQLSAQQLAAQLETLRTELEDYRQDAALLADPVQGTGYAMVRDKALQLADYCRHSGSPVPLESAYAAVLARELPGLLAELENRTRTGTLQALQANAAASPGALGHSAPEPTPDFAGMSSSEFAEYRRRALNGERF